jgi:hypothetical protein
MIRIVVVAGRIGCGKSTLLECLEREGYSVLPEPVEEWRKKGWLEKFYENPTAKAFSFQLGVYNTAITNVQQKLATCKNPKGGILFVERYIYDQLLFWQTQIESGRVDDMDNEIYMGIWQRFRDYIPEPSGYILLLDNPIKGGSGAKDGVVKSSSPHDTPPIVVDSFTQSMMDSGYLMNMGKWEGKSSLPPSLANIVCGRSSSPHDTPPEHELLLCECDDSSSDDPPHTCEGRLCGGCSSPTIDPTSRSLAIDGILSRGRPEELKASKDGGLDAYQEILGRKHLEFFASERAHPPHAPPDGFPCIHLETRLYPYHEKKTQIVEIIEEWIEKING